MKTNFSVPNIITSNNYYSPNKNNNINHFPYNDFATKICDTIYNTTKAEVEKIENYLMKENLNCNISLDKIDSDGYTQQGLTKIGNQYVVSAYKDYRNSRLYVYNMDGSLDKIIELNYQAHVGGITYDEENGILVVTERNGHVIFYDWEELDKDIKTAIKHGGSSNIELQDIIKDNDAIELCDFDTNGDEINKNAATVTYSDGKIYAATFESDKRGRMDVYNINVTKKDGKKKIEYEHDYTSMCPAQTQGVAVHKYNGEDYIVFSSSYSPFCDSKLSVYKIDGDGYFTYKGCHYDGIEGNEGINIQENGVGAIISEFDDKLRTFKFEDLINNLENDKRSYDYYRYEAGTYDSNTGIKIFFSSSLVSFAFKNFIDQCQCDDFLTSNINTNSKPNTFMGIFYNEAPDEDPSHQADNYEPSNNDSSRPDDGDDCHRPDYSDDDSHRPDYSDDDSHGAD